MKRLTDASATTSIDRLQHRFLSSKKKKQKQKNDRANSDLIESWKARTNRLRSIPINEAGIKNQKEKMNTGPDRVS